MKVYFRKIKKILLYGGLEKEEFVSLQNDINKANQSNLKAVSIITTIYMVVLITVSLKNIIPDENKQLYMGCFCISLGIMIISFLHILNDRLATLIVMYLFMSAILIFGIAIGVSKPTHSSTSFLIFIMIGPLLFYDQPLKINCFVTIFTFIFIAISRNNKTLEAAEIDMTNGIIFATFSCFINTRNMVSRIERVWFEKQLEVNAEMDSLTNLKNRNCFEHNYYNYADSADNSVTCIYIDANGLHELNASQGHDAGDRMLRCLGEQVINFFGQDHAYRIGGDEFMIFCCDVDVCEIEHKVACLSDRMKEWQYSISVGVVTEVSENLNMEELTKKADAEMYLAKKRYYAQAGVNRRKNR